MKQKLCHLAINHHRHHLILTHNITCKRNSSVRENSIHTMCEWIKRPRSGTNNNPVKYKNTSANLSSLLPYDLAMAFTISITCSTVVLQCYRRQAIPMEQAKIRPSATWYSLDLSLIHISEPTRPY